MISIRINCMVIRNPLNELMCMVIVIISIIHRIPLGRYAMDIYVFFPVHGLNTEYSPPLLP
jgi:hypothetical protein